MPFWLSTLTDLHSTYQSHLQCLLKLFVLKPYFIEPVIAHAICDCAIISDDDLTNLMHRLEHEEVLLRTSSSSQQSCSVELCSHHHKPAIDATLRRDEAEMSFGLMCGESNPEGRHHLTFQRIRLYRTSIYAAIAAQKARVRTLPYWDPNSDHVKVFLDIFCSGKQW